MKVYLKKMKSLVNRQLETEKMLQKLLMEEYQLKSNEIEIIRDKNGKPFLKNNSYYISISHSDPYVLFGVSKYPIGVDLEQKRNVTEYLMNKVCSTEEKETVMKQKNVPVAFLKLWTLKESYLKLYGKTIHDIFNISFHFQNGTWKIIDDNKVRFVQHVTPQFIIAICEKNI